MCANGSRPNISDQWCACVFVPSAVGSWEQTLPLYQSMKNARLDGQGSHFVFQVGELLNCGAKELNIGSNTVWGLAKGDSNKL